MFFFLSIGLKSKTCLNEISIIGYNLDLNLVLSLLSWGTLFNQSSCVTVHIHISDALFQSRPDRCVTVHIHVFDALFSVAA